MKKMKIISLLICSIPMILSVGCGQVYSPNLNYAPLNSLVTTNYSPLNSVVAAQFSCPGLPNVVPNVDQTSDGSDYFTVCTSKTAGDFSDILVTGKFSSSNSLCAVPVQMLDPTHFKPKLDAEGNAVYTCSAPTAEGAQISLPSANSSSFNAVIIVESHELNNLISCLANDAFLNCPNYSFGKFR